MAIKENKNLQVKQLGDGTMGIKDKIQERIDYYKENYPFLWSETIKGHGLYGYAASIMLYNKVNPEY